MFRKGSLLREFPILLAVALAVSLLIKTFIVQFFYIPSGSMENTLQINDRVAVNKLPFISNTIHRGDVIVFRDPDNWLPSAEDTTSNKYLKLVREGLVAVGILPNPAKQYLVKRVIGVGGDNVKCCSKDGRLIINGKAVDEPYIFAGNKPSDTQFSVKVPEGKVWVMGDHRNASADSRYHMQDINDGFVPVSKVSGRVVAVIWPLKNATIVHSVNVLK